jgi:hypothetical protein
LVSVLILFEKLSMPPKPSKGLKPFEGCPRAKKIHSFQNNLLKKETEKINFFLKK